MGSIDPFNRLVKLTARAFYDDATPMKGDGQSKNPRPENRGGMAVVVLDALTRRQWVREEDLAKSLKIHSKQLRRVLRCFEEEKLVVREHRKESAKGAKVYNAAAAAAGDVQPGGAKEGEEKAKMHTYSYCCLDYSQVCDVVRYRIHRMKKKVKDELDNGNTIQHYVCPNCSKRYSAFDALQLRSYTDDGFHCERCDAELLVESDKLASEEMGDGDDNPGKRKREKLKDMQRRLEEQLKPLQTQLDRVRDLPAPEFGSLQVWERVNIGAFAHGSAADSSRDALQGQYYSGTQMPFLGDTTFDVKILGAPGAEKDGPESGIDKAVPPWMITKNMNLTKEQRGEASAEQVVDEQSEVKDDQKDKESINEEYWKAYYEAVKKQQEEYAMQQGSSQLPSVRQVSVKSKREEDEEEDVQQWGIAADLHKSVDLNAQSPESAVEEDGVVWEDGALF